MPNQAQLIPVSAVIATRKRAQALRRTLDSLAQQSAHPHEIIIIDSSEHSDSKTVVETYAKETGSSVNVVWENATVAGAAAQRNQGVRLVTEPFILFCDDDIIFEPGCVFRMWSAMSADSSLGGVNAMIVNQKYHSPGIASRFIFSMVGGRKESTYAGKVIGPAVNLLPEDRQDLPDVVPVEWLNTTCTMYRRQALPDPPFPSQFTGYSLMEDIALSLQVGKRWKLANARTARIFHDSQPADYKCDQRLLNRMLVTNRYFVMTEILNRRSLTDHARFLLWEFFQLLSVFANCKTRRNAIAMLRGQLEGYGQILSRRS